MALADQFDGFLIDLDGVVWVGGKPLPGAADALLALLDAGKELVFVTNNPAKAPAAYAERLREAGVQIESERVITAGLATAQLATESLGGSGKVFVIGASALKRTVEAAGATVLDVEAGGEAEAVVVSGHRGFDYAELLAATFALRGGAGLFATSRDPTLPMPGGAWPGTGAILAAVETASGRVAQIGGKPERHLFEMARGLIGGARRVAMVGDRVATDIEGGRRAGLATILVLSGSASKAQAAAAEPAPDHVIDDLADLLR